MHISTPAKENIAPTREPGQPAKGSGDVGASPSAANVPEWLAQPEFVADAKKDAPALHIAQPAQGRLTIAGQSRPTPFSAFDLDGPAAKAFAERNGLKGKVWGERAPQSAVDWLSVSHSVCNSVGHTLHVHALNGTSNHLVVNMDGTVHQLVDLSKKALAAGMFDHRLVGMTFVNPVDPRVEWTEASEGAVGPSKIYEPMPRHRNTAYRRWRISDAQKDAAANVIRWLSQQPEFNIEAEVMDPRWVPERDDEIQAKMSGFRGAVGLYQIRRTQIAPGFDAMEGLAERLATSSRAWPPSSRG